jgi:hypothetical protein
MNRNPRTTVQSNADDNLTLPRHRWYEFKEAFSPSLVRKAIEETKCLRSDYIVDPFCGSGTVPLTAAELGINSYGIEVNPFMSFVAETKLTTAKPTLVLNAMDGVVAGAKNGQRSKLESFSSFCEGSSDKWLFNRDVLRSFEGAWQSTANSPKDIKRLLRLGLIAAAMDVCNAEKDGKCLRYRPNWSSDKFTKDDFINHFRERIGVMSQDLTLSPLHKIFSTKLFPGDSRKVLSSSIKNKFKLCLTSPPYLNSFDYTDIYRPELFLGRFVNSQEQLYALRLKTLRSHVQAKWNDPKVKSTSSLLREALNELEEKKKLLWNARIPMMIEAYFEDMASLMWKLRKKSLDDASLWIVVASSAYAGTEIPVDLILADIGQRNGWQLRKIEVFRRLRAAGQHFNKWDGHKKVIPMLRESLLVFDAAKLKKG